VSYIDQRRDFGNASLLIPSYFRLSMDISITVGRKSCDKWISSRFLSDNEILYYTVTKLPTRLRYLVSHHEILKSNLVPSHDSKIFVLQFVLDPRTLKTMQNSKESETLTNKLGGLNYSNDLWASYKVRMLWYSLPSYNLTKYDVHNRLDHVFATMIAFFSTYKLCKLNTLGRSEINLILI